MKRLNKYRISKLLVVFFVLFILYPITIKADHNEVISFERILAEDGYSDSHISAILQDEYGFIWFGTTDGVCRYDGTRVVLFNNDPDRNGSLSNNSVQDLFLDSLGILWIGTENGLNRYHRETETFTVYQHRDDSATSLSHNLVTEIYEDESGLLWIGTYNGLNLFDRKTETFSHFHSDPTNPNSLSANSIHTIIADSRGVLWVGTGNGLNRFHRGKKTFARYMAAPEEPGKLKNDNITSVYEDSKGILWIGTWGDGICKYSRENDWFTSYSVNSQEPDSNTNIRITRIYEDRSGELWVGTRGNGLCRYKRDNDTFVSYKYDVNDSRSLSSNRVQSIFEDRTGILWIGTVDGGINKYNRHREKIQHFTHDPRKETSLSDNMVHCLYEPPGKEGRELWIGTYSAGLNRWDREKNRFTHFKHDSQNPNSISSNQIFHVIQDKTGALWVGTKNGLNRFDRETETFTIYRNDPKNPKSISSNTVVTIHQSEDGDLWLGTMKGLNNLNLETGEFKHFENDPHVPVSISSDIIFFIYEPHNIQSPVLWIGTYSGGLNKFDKKSETFSHYTFNSNRPNDTQINTIRTIINIEKTLWLGSDGGLIRFAPTTGKYSVFTTNDGLISNKIYGILADSGGHLWLCTDKGLSRYHIKTGVFKTFDISQGIRINEFLVNAYYKSRSGEMFFGGMNGFLTFFPDRLKPNPHIPEVVFTDLTIMNKTVGIGKNLNKAIPAADEIHLSYKDFVFTISFAALDYYYPKKNRYAYRMEGYSNDWIQLGKKKQITFTGLSPDDYVLNVKACNNDGVWNEKGRSINIFISPPFYSTWWAYGIYFLLALVAIVTSHKLRVRHLKKRKEELAELVKLRTSELADANDSLKKANTEITIINNNLRDSMTELAQANDELRAANVLKSEFLGIAAHDLKNPLQVILGYTFILKTKLEYDKDSCKELDSINRSVEKMLDLISDVLETASIERGKLKLKKTDVNVAQLAESVVESNKTIAAKKNQKIIYTFEKNCILSGDKRMLMQVMENLISNAIKYSPLGKTIWVSVARRDAFIEFKVKDEGPGFSENDKKSLFRKFKRLSARPTGGESSTGLGLSICKSMVELHNGSIKVDSQIKKGSTFIILLPVDIESTNDPI